MHAYYAPSSAGIWGHCNGFLKASEGLEDSTSADSARGTCAHWLSADAFENEITDAFEYLGAKDPDGTVVDENIAEGAQFMIDYLEQLAARVGRDAVVSEKRVYMPQIHPENHGTPDAHSAVPSERRIIVGDYKHGHRIVEADAYQLVNYALGVLNEHMINPFLPENQDILVEMTVIQPFAFSRHGPVKTVTRTVADLMPVWSKLYDQATSAPHMTAGKHCRDCPIVGKCSTARAAGYSALSYVKEAYRVDEMNQKDLSAELDILREASTLIKERLEAVEAEIRHGVEKGDTSSGYGLTSVKGREKWTADDSQVIETFAALGVDVAKTAPLTPGQARKAAAAAPGSSAVLGALAERKTSLQLTPLDETPSGKAFSKK